MRERARTMRREGSTYDEIAAELGVSKSTVSLWTRDLPRPSSPRDWSARREGHRRYYEELRRRKFIERQVEKVASANMIGDLSDRELVIAGAVAYWAEGTKAKPWRSEEKVVFVNSDPAMITVFLAFLRLLGVEPERLRLQMHIHESADVESAAAFWSDVVQTPREGVPEDRPEASLRADQPEGHR